jgi:hypothetical protein
MLLQEKNLIIALFVTVSYYCTIQFREVDLDLCGQNKTFFSKRFLMKILISLLKNGILRSAKRFCEVDLDL